MGKWNPQLEQQKIIFGRFAVKSLLLERIKEAQRNDPMIQRWMEKKKKGEMTEYKMGPEGVLKFRDRIIVPRNEELRKEIRKGTPF